MKTLLRIVKSKWWDLAPVPAFVLIALLEGKGYWIGGVMTIVWLFSLALRHLVKE